MSNKSKSYEKSAPKVYIRTFGCQMNVRDSEIITGMLQRKGYRLSKTIGEADAILFNTCSVRQHAEERLWDKLGMLKRFTAEGSSLSLRTNHAKRRIIGVIGCTAENYQFEIFRRFPYVDLVCGPANIYDIPDLLEKAIKENTQVMAVDKNKRPLNKDFGYRPDNIKAYVSIMYGCNNFCSYCIVPFVRGREVSRPIKHILDEVEGLARRGCKEITLLGQNVNSYGKDLKGRINFVSLLEELDKIKGIERIRFITSHPKDASQEMFKAMRDLPKVCEHLHLPLQAGSDKILKLMNRKYSLSDYLKLVDYLKKIIPGCSLTTDIIVGFPGESETDFKKTYQAMEKIQFDDAYIFKYSPRPKTQAAELKDNVFYRIKQQRNQILLKLQEEVSLKKNKCLVGGSVEVLTEGPGNYFGRGSIKNVLQGRSRTNKVTLFSGTRNLISRLLKVKITKVTTHTLKGEVDGKKI